MRRPFRSRWQLMSSGPAFSSSHSSVRHVNGSPRGLPGGRRFLPLIDALGLWSDAVPAQTSLEGLSIPLLPDQNIPSGAPLGKD